MPRPALKLKDFVAPRFFFLKASSDNSNSPSIQELKGQVKDVPFREQQNYVIEWTGYESYFDLSEVENSNPQN